MLFSSRRFKICIAVASLQLLSMGNTASRAKRVAPVLETQHHALEPRTALEGGRLFSSPKAPTSEPRRSRQDCPSESALVSGEERLEEEVERILGAYENPDSGLSTRLFQKAFFSSKTCGLCYGQEDETTMSSSRDNIRLVHSEAMMSREHHSSEDREEMCHKPVGGGRADPVYTKATCVPVLCEHPPLALPVLYDASEEDLMNIIERDFG